jgi:zinc/manganese transport system ATP-binding protein
MRFAASARRPVLRLHELTVSWHGHPVVHRLSGVFRTAGLTAIVGPNGAGKSSLLAALAGGRVQVTGRIERRLPQRLAYLPQADEMDLQFPIRLGEFVAMGLWSRIGWWGGLGRQERDLLHEALATTGLGGMQSRLVGELSVGQRQRARFARLMLQNADLILLDEPFNAVDARTTCDLLDLLPHWRAQGRTVIAVLHELEHALRCFDEALMLARELIAWGPVGQVLTAANLERAGKRVQSWNEFGPGSEAKDAPPAAGPERKFPS